MTEGLLSIMTRAAKDDDAPSFGAKDARRAAARRVVKALGLKSDQVDLDEAADALSDLVRVEADDEGDEE